MTTRKNDKLAKVALAAMGVAIAYTGYLMGYNRGERDVSIAFLSKLVF